MSRFYFTMRSLRSKIVTRRCHGRTAPDEYSGRTNCASYHGTIECVPYIGAGDVDCVRITREPWKGSDSLNVLIYDGPFTMAGAYATDLK